MAINMDLYSQIKNQFQDFKDAFDLTNKGYTESSIVAGEKPEDLQMALSRLPNTDVCFPAELISRIYKDYGINLASDISTYKIPYSFDAAYINKLSATQEQSSQYKEEMTGRYNLDLFKNTYVRSQVKRESNFANMILSTSFIGIAGFKLSGKSGLIKAMTGLTVNLDPVVSLADINTTTKTIQFFIHNKYCPKAIKQDSINYFNNNFELADLWDNEFDTSNLVYSSKLISFDTARIPADSCISVVFCDAEILNYCSLIEYPGCNYEIDNEDNDRVFDLIYKKAWFAESVFFLSSSSSHCYGSNEIDIRRKLVTDGFGGYKEIHSIISRAHLSMQASDNNEETYKLSFNDLSLNNETEALIKKVIEQAVKNRISNGVIQLGIYRRRTNNDDWFSIINLNKNTTQETITEIKKKIEIVPKALELWKVDLFKKEEEYILSIITEEFITENLPKKDNSKILKVNADTLTDLAGAFYSVYEPESRKIWNNFEFSKANDMSDNLFTCGSENVSGDIIIHTQKLLTFGLKYYSDPFYDTLHLLNSADRPNAKGIKKVLLEGKNGKPGVIDRFKVIWEKAYFYYSYYAISNMEKYKDIVNHFSEISKEELETYENLFTIVDEVDAIVDNSKNNTQS